jgi:integrase
MTERLTDRAIKAIAAPKHGMQLVYDTMVTGFAVRVTAAGAKSFVLRYRTRHGRERTYTIGAFPDWQTTTARREAAMLKRRVDAGGDPVSDIVTVRKAATVDGLCNRFIAEYLPRKRISTQSTYRLQIESEIRPALGRLKVAAVTFDDIDAVHRGITKRGRPYRANRVVALLSRMFSMAVKWRMRTDNPCKGIERNTEYQRRRYLSTDELSRLAAALEKLRDQQSANIIRLLLLTGARRGEALQARWADIDLTAGTWSKPASSTKQDAPHTVPLSAAACRLLNGIRQQAPRRSEWVFPDSNGGHRRDVKEAWATACRAAGIKGARLHDARHTFASVLASAGLSLPVIGALLGHATPVTTARYSHLFDDPLRAATERASAIIAGAESADIVPLPDRRRG